MRRARQHDVLHRDRADIEQVEQDRQVAFFGMKLEDSSTSVRISSERAWAPRRWSRPDAQHPQQRPHKTGSRTAGGHEKPQRRLERIRKEKRQCAPGSCAMTFGVISEKMMIRNENDQRADGVDDPILAEQPDRDEARSELAARSPACCR